MCFGRCVLTVLFFWEKKQDPDLSEQQLDDRDFIVMASDGLWDVISNQEVVHLVAMEAAKTGWSPVLSSIAY